ncbi:GntR family transcriptional regulator [Pseudonocardia aurantiaca]|uniref:GntR family transcriptional regulator n=1 Tax=Pseudonocardia aurantiaca TaxID=75290 RepID=A0ABW4FU80_9PSEU
MKGDPVINRHSGVPLYGQIAQDLEGRLGDDYEPGDRLPSVAELAERYEVNRLTVHEALGVLVRRGLVTTVKGKGSFVALPIIRWDVRAGQDASLTQAMGERGHAVENRVLGVVEDDDPELREQLGATRALLRFESVRYVDDEPWSMTSTWFDPDRFPRLDELWVDRSSLHLVLKQEYGVRMRRSTRTFAALAADATEGQILRVPVASPILQARGLNVDEQGRPVAAVEHRFRGDRIQFSVELG